MTVAWGRHDRLLPARQARRARLLLPAARHEWLEGCGHLPMAEAPERVAELVLCAPPDGSTGRPGATGPCR